jgi:hypothetical protein
MLNSKRVASPKGVKGWFLGRNTYDKVGVVTACAGHGVRW